MGTSDSKQVASAHAFAELRLAIWQMLSLKFKKGIHVITGNKFNRKVFM